MIRSQKVVALFAETLSVRVADQMGVEVVLESMLENFFFSLSLKERPNKLERLLPTSLTILV